ncbi:UDP-glucose 4-epimerase GalE [Dietzia sp.]|uniref:UDP-glucose 4-epimerase GalE n=1 Tax=Dietzia sp. TaxID=1871616 RepID=UPI002FD92462
MRVLVTGGAGYVGSVCAAELLSLGHEVVVLDDLSTGNRDAVPEGARFIEGNLLDDSAAALEGVDAVIHCAARSLVGESVEQPAEYWQGNVVSTLALLEAMRSAGVRNIVFSSTAATYGEPEQVPITEDMPTRPTNTYGATKLAIDQAITSYCVAYGFAATSLRYFNVAGAHLGHGENRVVETHLIPLVLQVAAGHREEIKVFGDNWPTPDGTCVRDYIHVGDLADAHVLALESNEPGVHRIFNLGSGEGFSVQEVIDVCREVTGHEIPASLAPRRAGDPATLIASSALAENELGWKPKRTELRTVVADAWDFLGSLGDAAHSARR